MSVYTSSLAMPYSKTVKQKSCDANVQMFTTAYTDAHIHTSAYSEGMHTQSDRHTHRSDTFTHGVADVTRAKESGCCIFPPFLCQPFISRLMGGGGSRGEGGLQRVREREGDGLFIHLLAISQGHSVLACVWVK